MVRISISTLVWLAAAAASSTLSARNSTSAAGNSTFPADNEKTASNNIARAFMLECEDGQDLEQVSRAVQECGGQVRQKFDNKVFRGMSVQQANETQSKGERCEVEQLPGIKNIWPLQANNVTTESEAANPPADPEQAGEQEQKQNNRRALGRRARDRSFNAPWSHLMTHVDKLHQKGFSGNGVKIAVVDTGVNYTHPALGGCFGTGCRVALGDNLCTDTQDGGKKGDPMDLQGHGTIVAAILAGYDEEGGFVGAAPNATIHAYRILCSTPSERKVFDDDAISGWLKAMDDGADMIVASTGNQGSSWAQGPVATVVSRIVASGIPCVVALGNTMGPLFNVLEPATGRGVMAVNSLARASAPLEEKGAYAVDGGADVEFMLKAANPGRWDDEARDMHDVDADYGDKVDDLGDGEVVNEWHGPRYCNRDDEGRLGECQPPASCIGDGCIHPTCSLLAEQCPPDWGCPLKPGNANDTDLGGRVALIRTSLRTKNCSFEQRARNAEARGAAHILAWDDNPWTIKAPPGSKSIVAITESGVGKAMARALGAGKRVTMRRTGRLRIETGSPAKLSSLGPTWDLDIKPNVIAPGQDVPVPLSSGGGYGSDSGTSFAGPLVAGVYALIAEARNTTDPALLAGLLVATARPQLDKQDAYYSVAQQGGGLVNAWEAAFATTLVEPAGLTFNDTDHRVPSIGLRITNTAKSEVAYQLSNLPAITAHTLPGGSGNDPVRAGATVRLSKDSVTLGPGQSDTIDVSASDPEGLDLQRLPLWSGWVAINGSDGTSLTVPYLGLGGSLRTATVIENKFGVDGDKSAFVVPDPPAGHRQQAGLVKDFKLHVPAGKISFEPPIPLQYRLLLGSPQVHINVVPLDICPNNETEKADTATEPSLTRACVPETMIATLGSIKSMGQVAGYPRHYVERGKANVNGHVGFISVSWDGSLASGQYVPPGRYKLVVRALSLMGDADNESDWQVVESPEMTLAYKQTLGTDFVERAKSCARFVGRQRFPPECLNAFAR